MSEKAAIYLDANAAAPLKPEVARALLSHLSGPAGSGKDAGSFSNPSSVHSHGRNAKRILHEARRQVALSLGPRVFPEHVFFTSSGTEANQLAARLALEPLLLTGVRPHWILSAGEHDSLIVMAKWLEARGGAVSFLDLDSEGRPRLEQLQGLWRPETALVSLIWVNNETGVITDIEQATCLSRERGATLHLDGAQAWGKLPLSIESSGAGLVSFSGHKIGAPAGIGALWIRPELRLGILSEVGSVLGKQERSRRGGTENLLGAVALGAAASTLDPEAWQERVAPLRERLEGAICERIPGTRINGRSARRVANTISLNFEGVQRDGLVAALDLAGYSVSAGSACAAGVTEPSRVLRAMGRSEADARSAIRVSLADEVDWAVLEGFVTALADGVSRMRARQ
ncbi:MAG: cysteine desulfurase [Oligoflexia bacterium]|nr:cysteine desulfurase [Oligoflexia bacterium]